MLLQAADKLIVYNTLMGLAAAAGVLLLVPFVRYGSTAALPIRRAWAWTFGALGGLLTVLGVHTNVAWPLIG